jgi:hypothetical protein
LLFGLLAKLSSEAGSAHIPTKSRRVLNRPTFRLVI